MKKKDFPGAFCSWDCKHSVWDNCPKPLHGQHQGHGDGGGKRTIILEAIADSGSRFWHIIFCEPCSLNDNNVFNKSWIVGSIMSSEFPPYDINGTIRDWLYFLVDGIYPPWAIFVRSENHPVTEAQKKFASRQEAVRKDIEKLLVSL
jgi:hypothetical protein